MYYDYECEQCDRSFSSQRALNDHLKFASVHRGRWCERCELLFDSRSELETHKADLWFHQVCCVCHVDCADEKDLEEHLREEHFQCERCLKWGPSTRDLEMHIEKLHYYCSLCESFFENENNLRQVGGDSQRADSPNLLSSKPRDVLQAPRFSCMLCVT